MSTQTPAEPGAGRHTAPETPGTGGGAADRRRQRSTREAYFDNARFLAVILVVAGHAWEPLRGSRPIDAAHLFVYAFHLPVFVLIAGHLGRGFSRSRDRARRLVTGLAIPYLIFDIAYPAVAAVGGDRRFVWAPLEPYYLTWFLLALLCWRVSVPLWRRLRHPVPVAVVIAVLAELTTVPTALAADRVAVLLPFFVLGLRLRRAHFAVLRRLPVRVAAVAVLLTGMAGAYALAGGGGVDPEWVAWRYGQLTDVPALTRVGLRLTVLLAAAVLTAAFLALVPARRMWFSRFGSATLYAYLLHGFAVQTAVFAGWYEAAGGRVGAVAVTVIAVALTFVLVTPPVRQATRWAVEPRLPWLWVPRRGESGERGHSR